MENTIENKAKFYAQYWGQSLYTKPSYDGEGGLKPVEYFSLSKGMIEEGILELTSLSDITDEDASKLVLKGYNGDIIRKHTAISFKEEYDIMGFLTQEEADILRSMGYALPWMGVSVEEQIKRGWMKLKTK